MKAQDVLEAAAGHMKDRAATYDKPEGERSMGATVEAFKAVTGIAVSETQGWLFMALLKAVRSQQGEFRADSFEDGAAYFALAGESAHSEQVDNDGGWIEWNGGACPVDAETMVEVESVCGEVQTALAVRYEWGHFNADGNIIRYRVI